MLKPTEPSAPGHVSNSSETPAKPLRNHKAATLLSRTDAIINITIPAGRSVDAARPTLFSGRRDLPVLGRAQGGSEGNIVIEDGAIDWTFRPADLQGVRDAFAVYVTGNSMAPKYKDKDLAYVHPGKTPRRGRYVLVETQEHRGFIKQFDRWDGETLVLRQFNPAEEIRIPRVDVLRLLLVIGSLDS